MQLLLPLVTAVAISLAVIPVMVRLAPGLGMIDRPDGRKVHRRPVPRVGGWGIFAGLLGAVLIWLPPDRHNVAFLLGAVVLFFFGSWDDRKALGHYTKFLGQFLAVLAVILLGELYVTSIPFWNAPLPYDFALGLTLFAMVGMINAINHSDGLDGLAGGEALLSLAAMAYLIYLSGELSLLALPLAAIGALLGFLRYNTHPAVLFMGDSGSQILGMTLGYVAVILTQQADPSISPAAALLLLGLPIADILVVLFKRIRGGMNWFRATRNHVHHRLLDLGFAHAESVLVIYAIQLTFVSAGIGLRHASDGFLMFLYVAGCALLFGSLALAERSGWRRGRLMRRERILVGINRALVVLPRRFLVLAVPLYLLSGSLLVEPIPTDFAVGAAIVAALLTLELLSAGRVIFRRALVYTCAAFIVYLYVHNLPSDLAWLQPLWIGFFIAMALSFVLAVRFSPRRRRHEFNATAMDYLLIVLLGLTAMIPEFRHVEMLQASFLMQLAIIFYACELLLVERRAWWSLLDVAAVVSMVVVALRGLLG